MRLCDLSDFLSPEFPLIKRGKANTRDLDNPANEAKNFRLKSPPPKSNCVILGYVTRLDTSPYKFLLLAFTEHAGQKIARGWGGGGVKQVRVKVEPYRLKILTYF